MEFTKRCQKSLQSHYLINPTQKSLESMEILNPPFPNNNLNKAKYLTIPVNKTKNHHIKQKDNTNIQDNNVQKQKESSLLQNCQQFSSVQNLINGINMTSILHSINKVLQIKPKNCCWNFYLEEPKYQQIKQLKQIHSNRTGNERQKYLQLIRWHQKSLLCIKKQVNKQSSVFEILNKQQKNMLLMLQVLCTYLSKQCEEKGLLIQIVVQQHIQLYSGLLKYMDQRIKTNLIQNIKAQDEIQTDFQEQIDKLKQQLESLHFEKDRKWKNLFMLIKDNRILRRTKGKLIRQLKAASYKNQLLKQNIIELTKQNERYKLLCLSPEYRNNGLQKWLKNMSSLIKIERQIKKQPKKTKRILQYQLQNLQISQMENLPEKTDYIIKAIQQAEQVVDFYEDLNDLIAPTKLLLNNQTQTQVQYESVGTNTINSKFINSYSQVHSCRLLQNGCSFESGNINLFIRQHKKKQPLNSIIDLQKRKASNISLGTRSQSLFIKNYSMNLPQFYNIYESKLHIVKNIDQTIIPQYVSDSINPFVYANSKFKPQLVNVIKIVNLSFHGSRGVIFHSVQSSSQNSKTNINKNSNYIKNIPEISQKRYSHVLNVSKFGLKQNQVQQHKIVQKNTDLYLEKRYSYNTNTIALQNRIKKQRTDEDFDKQQSCILSKQDSLFSKQNIDQITVNIKLVNDAGDQNSNSSSVRENNIIKININKQNDIISQEHSYISESSNQRNMDNKQYKIQNKAKDKAKQNKSQNNNKNNQNITKLKQKIQNITRHTVTTGLVHRRNTTNNKFSSQSNNLSYLQSINNIKNNTLGQIKKVRTSDQTNINFKQKSTKKQSNQKPRQLEILNHNSNTKNKKNQWQNEGIEFKQIKQKYLLPQEERYTNNYTPRQTNAKSKFIKIKNKSIDIIHHRKILQNGIVQSKHKQNLSNYNNNIKDYQISPLSTYSINNQNPLSMINNNNKTQMLHQIKRNSNKYPGSQRQSSDYGLYFQPQYEAASIDVVKTVLKLQHLIYVNRQQLKSSGKTLKQFVETNLKNIYGKNPQSNYISFNKSLAITILNQSYQAISQMQQHTTQVNQQQSPLSYYISLLQCFMRMLNSNTPVSYQNDLFKLYIILIQKSGRQNLIADVQKCVRVINYITSIFFHESDVGSIVKYTSNNLRLNNQTYVNGTSTGKNFIVSINLAEYFLILQSDLRQSCTQTQFYNFCRQILPQNQADLTYSQFLQILQFLPLSLQLQTRLSKFKSFFHGNKAQAQKNFYKNNNNKPSTKYTGIVSMKIHKISLYCCREKWEAVRNIDSTIQKQFNKMMGDNYYIKDLTELYTKIENHQQAKTKLKQNLPWLYKIINRQIRLNREYSIKVSRTLLMLIWVIQINYRIKNMGLIGNHLNSLDNAIVEVITRNNLKNQSINSEQENMKRKMFDSVNSLNNHGQISNNR